MKYILDIYKSVSKAAVITTVLTLPLVVNISIASAEVSNFRQEIYPITQCNDGIDNDGDGGIDFATDNECTSWTDTSEFPDPPPPPTPPPNPSQNPNPGSFLEGRTPIIVDVKDNSGEETDNSGSGTGFVQEFLYEPLGKILGLENENLEPSEVFSTEGLMLILLLIMIYLIVTFIIFFFYLRLKEKEDEEEDFNN